MSKALIVAALVCFVLATFGVTALAFFALVPLGFAFFMASKLV